MNKFKKIFKKFLPTSAMFFPLLAFAQSATSITIPNPTSGVGNNLMDVLIALLNKVVMPIAAVLVVMYIIYSGFLFVTAQGNPKKIEDARRNLLWALIGAGVLLGASAISLVVKNTVCGFLTGPCPV